MDGLETLLNEISKQGLAAGELRGLLHILIGRTIARDTGDRVSAGLTWRAAADLLKRVRWDVEAVRELGIEPDALPARDRQRYWFSAIAQAQVEAPEAVASGDRLAEKLKSIGYVVGPAPGLSR